MSKHHFDCIVIGAGLGGLLMASQLSRNNKKVAVFESTELLGGNCRAIDTEYGSIDSGLKTIPDSVAAREALAFLELILGRKVSGEQKDVSPMTFQKGAFQPFVGFGDNAHEIADLLSYYVSPHRIQLSETPKDWIGSLKDKFPFKIFTRAQVTQILGKEKYVQEIIVNGQDQYSADQFFFAAPLKGLSQILHKDLAGTRSLQKLAQVQFWTAVSLDLFHGIEVTSNESLHVLFGGSENAHPSVGYFSKPNSANTGALQHSQWLSFIPGELTENDESAGDVLREIKRQLKRAYPSALENLRSERILLAPYSHGSANVKFDLKNLYLVSGALNKEQNLVGTLLQVKNLLHELKLLQGIEESTLAQQEAPVEPNTMIASVIPQAAEDFELASL